MSQATLQRKISALRGKAKKAAQAGASSAEFLELVRQADRLYGWMANNLASPDYSFVENLRRYILEQEQAAVQTRRNAGEARARALADEDKKARAEFDWIKRRY